MEVVVHGRIGVLRSWWEAVFHEMIFILPWYFLQGQMLIYLDRCLIYES
jgi:hypothetical protein